MCALEFPFFVTPQLPARSLDAHCGEIRYFTVAKMGLFESKFEMLRARRRTPANCAAAREGWPAWRFATDFWAVFRAGVSASPMPSRACHVAGVGWVKLDDRRTDPVDGGSLAVKPGASIPR